MNNFIKKLTVYATAALLVIAALLGTAGCSTENNESNSKSNGSVNLKSGSYIEKKGYKNLSEEEQGKKGNYENAQSRIADMQLVAENSAFMLYLDPELAEFAAVDKQSGEAWFSNPYDFSKDTKAGSDAKAELQSLLTLTYYDVKAAEGTMNSYSDCTLKDQYQIEKLDGGFAIHMQIGRIEEKILAPDAIEVSKFEKLILPKVSEREAKRLNTYYTKVSLSDDSLSDGVKDKYLADVPGLKNNDFYILRDATDREKKLLEAIIEKTDYTLEDMEADTELSGSKEEKTSSALFNISLYVELTDSGLKVTVPSDKISYDDKQYYLGSFQLLKYFGAGKSENGGYLFVPDGSGALISYNSDASKTLLHTTSTVYGMDYSLSFDYGMNSLSQQIHFPVYGNKENNKAFLAVIEDGSAMANIISESGNIISSYETVYPQFTYEASYTVNYTDSTKIKGLYTYHDTNSYKGDYIVNYNFLAGERSDYVGMAEAYRSYLCKNGVLKKSGDGKAGFYLEALGAIEKTSTKFGIPYTESVALTTFSQAESIISEISDAADLSIRLKYKGWANNGLYYSVFNKAKVVKSLGGKNGLEKLEKAAVQNGSSLYPDADFFMVCKDGFSDGYRSSAQSARSIRKENLYLMNPQGFTNFAEFQYLNYSVSPYYYNKYIKEFFAKYNKLGLSGISVGSMGNMLYSEFRKSKAVNRETAMNTITENLGSRFSDYKLMLDGGNAYTLKYASDLTNVPMYNSAYTQEDESIPFMQLVLHGYIGYSGTALNLTGEYEDMFLKCIEYGSAPLFTVAAENTELLNKTSMSYYYSVKWDALKEKVKEYAARWKEAYDGLNDKEMKFHKKTGDNFYRTEYEDGTVFYVNYGANDAVTESGAVVPPRSYLKVKNG
ncbi:MAG TPA: hypothetical protein DCY23_06620 [Ruminococcaceae bacterium]|nr:hypothetical protein [Oscillospiraceae bacterium]